MHAIATRTDPKLIALYMSRLEQARFRRLLLELRDFTKPQDASFIASVVRAYDDRVLEETP